MAVYHIHLCIRNPSLFNMRFLMPLLLRHGVSIHHISASTDSLKSGYIITLLNAITHARRQDGVGVLGHIGYIWAKIALTKNISCDIRLTPSPVRPI